MVTKPVDSTGRLTKKRSRYFHLWIVVERLEEVFVGHLDISHPVEQILRPGIADCKFHELASHCHVRRTFDHVKTVRNRFFGCFVHREWAVADP